MPSEIYLNKINFSLVYAERFKVKAINNVNTPCYLNTTYRRAELWLYTIKIQSLRYIQNSPLISNVSDEDLGYVQDSTFWCFGKL